jgi:glycerophosphoryl diester phosphodiesterase
MPSSFDLQGHRGARGLRPENTLPAFETALDLRVSTLETDLQLTRDGVPVLFHDAALSERSVRVREGISETLDKRRAVRALSLVELRQFIVDRNPDLGRFPEQKNDVTLAARLFCEDRKQHVYAIPALSDLLEFVAAYAGELGRAAGKSSEQRAHARSVRFNLELKRVPFRPDAVGDKFDGNSPSDLERAVVGAVRKGAAVEKVTIQSFDHRAVKAVKQLDPKLATAILIAGTAPVSPAALAKDAGAAIYSPDYQFLDAALVRETQAAGIRVIPWTVNEVADMERLLDWRVDGMITDVPQRLIPLLQARHMPF